MLVPLTQSLYVPGELGDPDQLLVELGTGYYIEKTQQGATGLLDRKIGTVSKNAEDATVVASKQQNYDAIVRTMQVKMAQIQERRSNCSASRTSGVFNLIPVAREIAHRAPSSVLASMACWDGPQQMEHNTHRRNLQNPRARGKADVGRVAGSSAPSGWREHASVAAAAARSSRGGARAPRGRPRSTPRRRGPGPRRRSRRPPEGRVDGVTARALRRGGRR